MKTRLAELALVLISVLCAGSFAVGQSTSTYRGADGSTIVVSASTITLGADDSRLVLTGQAHVKAFNKAQKTTLDARADKIVVRLFQVAKPALGAPPQQGTVKSAELTGSPRMIYTMVDPTTGATVKTDATSDSATYDGVSQMAHLRGNVKILNENPTLFAGPATMTGDEATINLKTNLGPDEDRYKITSSPGVSKIEVTPKPKEEAQKK